MYLKKVLDFYSLDNDVKIVLKEQLKGKVSGSARVDYGLPQ